jgi:hypothetical protein
MIGFIDNFFCNHSSLLYSLHKSLGDAKSSQSSLVVSWQRIYNSLTVTTAHIKSSFHRLTSNWQLNWINSSEPPLQSSTELVESSLLLRPTVSRPVSLGIKHPSGAYDQIFITVWQLRVCWCATLSLTRGRVCRLQLQLALASAVIFGSESRRTRGHILLSHIW